MTKKRKSSKPEEESRSQDAYCIVGGFQAKCEDFIAILDNFPEYLYVSDPESHELLFANSAFRRLLKEDCLHGKKCYEIFQGASEPCEFCTNNIIMKTGMPHVWDNYNTHLGRHFLNTDQIITWHDGRKVRLETAIDITDHKKVEALLQATENKYRSFIEKSTYGFFIMNLGEEIVYLNKVARGIYDLGEKEPGTIRVSDLLGPQDYAMASENLKAIAAGEDVERPGIYTIRLPKGVEKIVEVQSFPIWRDGKLNGFHGTVLDITDKAKAEKQLREKSEFLDAVINNTSEGIFVVDEDIRYILINPASGRILGHDPEKWIGKMAGSYTHPDDAARNAEAFFKAVEGEFSVSEVRVRASDGDYHLLEIKYSRMMLNDNLHILGMVKDITEENMAENALRESQEKYHSLFEFSPESIILAETDGKIIECNRATEKIFRMKRGDIIGKTYQEVCGFDDRESEYIIGMFESLIMGSRPESAQMEFGKDSEAEGWIEVIPTLMRQGGNSQAIQIISKDITDTKKVEMEMRKKLMRYSIREGHIYLDTENPSRKMLEAFDEHLAVGFSGTIITRESKKEYDKSLGSIFRCVRITDMENPDMDRYTPDKIRKLVSEMPRGEVVLFNCLEYCISRLGMDEAMGIVHYIRDCATMRHLTILLSVDMAAVPEKCMRLIELETRPLEKPDSLTKLPKKLMDALEYISERNAEGANPSYSDIGSRFNVSKPTVRAWAKALENAGAVLVTSQGRMKTIKVTKKWNRLVGQS